MYTGIYVVLPLPRDIDAPVENLSVLTLLHGMGDDYTAWIRQTCVEQYALQHNVAVVMPYAGQSSYTNMLHGPAWRDYLCYELPERLQSLFPLSKKRDDNAIAGCSMGGAGALKLALTRPDLFTSVGLFSAGLCDFHTTRPRIRAMQARAYSDPDNAENSWILDRLKGLDKKEDLRMFFSYGDTDILKNDVLQAVRTLEHIANPNLTFHVLAQNGSHNWIIWDDALKHFLAWWKPQPNPSSAIRNSIIQSLI